MSLRSLARSLEKERRVYRLPSILIASIIAAAEPPPAAGLRCGNERFVAGERLLPSYREAWLQCRNEEHALTHPQTGTFAKERTCYDVTSPGTHGEWQYGRIAMDVIERHSGDAYTFETLWMCKPM